ncbi:phosphatidylinositol glycan, class B [Porphyromonadaceae bacterium KH3CP3RA]|nr:phosphatidylinositol glycan, class B [Porphyromonadaceae bacterium KH3CP3RA]
MQKDRCVIKDINSKYPLNINRFVLILIIILYLFSTINSNGFHHPDEHFQLIEFAGLKAGWNTGDDLAWEYDAQIRPALQPYLALGVFKLAGLFGIKDPFILATLLRGLTAVFSILSVLFFISCFKPSIKNRYHPVLIVLSFFIWFFPSINVRFSSETWSGLCLLISVGLVELNRQSKLRYFIIGVLFGLSFEFRFQTALAIAGIILWLICIRKNSFREILYIFWGSILIVALCTALDSLFYGQFVFTPYNYFRVNIIENVSSHYGTAPWYAYITSILIAPNFLIGAVILLSFTILLVYDYKNIILWAIIPFIVFHSVIPHKELRFLFPLINFVPFLLVYAYQQTIDRIKKKNFLEIFFNSVLLAMLCINLGGLAMMLFKPAGNGSVNLIHYISRKYGDTGSLAIYSLKNNNLYISSNSEGLNANFYIPDNLILKDITTEFLTNPEPNQLVVLSKGHYTERALLEKNGYKMEKPGIPAWIMELNKFYGVFNEAAVPILYTQENDYERD